MIFKIIGSIMNNLGDIRLFVEAASLGGLSATGRKLGLSPAAASASDQARSSVASTKSAECQWRGVAGESFHCRLDQGDRLRGIATKSLFVAGGTFDNYICAHIHLLRVPFDCVSSHSRIFETVSS